MRASAAGASMTGFRDHAASGLDMHVVARPEVVVVIQFGDSPLAVENACGEPAFGGVVAGLSPGTPRIRTTRVECVELRLSPLAAYSRLGVSPRELHGTLTDLDHLWGARARLLRDRLAETDSWEARFALTSRFLIDRDSSRSPDPEVAAAWARIVTDVGGVTVRELTELTGWSRKRLWSRFTAQIGVTPKHAAMVVRFRRAFDLLLAGTPPARVAAACGYADQPHLHRDIALFAGTTPGALARN